MLSRRLTLSVCALVLFAFACVRADEPEKAPVTLLPRPWKIIWNDPSAPVSTVLIVPAKTGDRPPWNLINPLSQVPESDTGPFAVASPFAVQAIGS